MLYVLGRAAYTGTVLICHYDSSSFTDSNCYGNTVALQLNKCGVKTAALVRASQEYSCNEEDALRKPAKSADIRIRVGSPDGDQDKLAELLREFDTVVSDRR